MSPKQRAIIVFSILGILACSVSRGVHGAEYEATWESLISHEVPEWLLDAKFGIYAHWGVYSVPAFGHEWYAKRMYDPSNTREIHEHHRAKYGDPSEFGYKNFIPMFKAENYDPAHWADLIARSGAKYAGIAVVHHDGFGLWDSDVNQWNVGKMGPKRDLYGELVKELRKHEDMKIIATFHHIRTFDWYLPEEQYIEMGRKAGWDLFDPAYYDLYWNRFTGKYEDFITQWRAKVEEVSDKYQPDVLWFDGGEFQTPEAQPFVLSLLSDYYNKGERWGKQVEVLNKLPGTMKWNFPYEFGVLTFEEGRDRDSVVDRPWIDDMKISIDSWGYVKGQEYKSAREILHGLIDRTARGGGLLLSLCPKADGTLTPEQEEALIQLGDWFRVNGEAIYASRPWKIHAEGSLDHIRVGGAHSKWVFDKCGAGDIRFTCRDNTLYALALGWPEDGKLKIESLGTAAHLATGEIQRIELLGRRRPLEYVRDATGLTLELPRRKPNDLAYAFKITVDGELVK